MKITYFLNYFDFDKPRLLVQKSLEEVMRFMGKVATKEDARVKKQKQNRR